MPGTVSGPGIAKAEVSADLVSSIDSSGASLAAAGLAIPENVEGRDFLAAGYAPRGVLIAARDRWDSTCEKIRAVVTPRYVW